MHVRPDLRPLLGDYGEAHIVVVEPHPRDLADGGQGRRELCRWGSAGFRVGLQGAHVLVNVLMFRSDVLNRIVAVAQVVQLQVTLGVAARAPYPRACACQCAVVSRAHFDYPAL